MSFCYDTMEKAWQHLRQSLPADIRDGEVAIRFEFLIADMHEANHRLRDAINHDDRVTASARRLDRALNASEVE